MNLRRSDRIWGSTFWVVTVLLLSPTRADAAHVPSTMAEQTVRDWLRHELGPPKQSSRFYGLPRYTLAWSDLNGDGRPEALAYISGRGWCGTGGCDMYILEVGPSRIRRLASTTITRPPISVLETPTHGYRDVAVRVCGGGIIRCYRARLQFDGRTYTSNPSMAYHVKGHPPERVVIGDNDSSRSVFDDERTRTLDEFGLSASFPSRAQVCDSDSGGHLHGWYMPLESGCDPPRRRVSITADYNSAFRRSPREASLCATADKSHIVQLGETGASIPKLRSDGCRVDLDDGTVILAVTAQAGRWPRKPADKSPDFQTPYINYEVRLHTDQAHLDTDVEAFSQVLAGVDVKPPRR